MNLRNYGWLFGTTLLIGGVGGVLSGLLFSIGDLSSTTATQIAIVMGMNLLIGLTISVISQMGFFAYMTVNYLALSFFKNAALWRNIQIFLVLFTFFDLIYLRYSMFGNGENIAVYFVIPVLLLLIAVVTAYAKAKVTNASAWVPTIFFLFVATTIELIPALKQDSMSSIIFMIIPLLFCNVWQVMQLHRLTRKES